MSRRHRSGTHALPSPADDTTEADAGLQGARLPAWAWLGTVIFFLIACAFGVLEIHLSTDTWISLRAGKDILAAESFPKTDTWSYTAAGRPWLNQNWLSHVYFWLLYDKVAPDAVIIGTWALGVAFFVFVLFAVWLRTGSWLAATIAAALVAIASRDWLSARPATVQFFCVALTWLCLSAWLGQKTRPRWWPFVPLTIVFLVWPHAHGSFLFGFGLLGMFVVCANFPALLGRPRCITGRQTLAILGLIAAASVFGVVLSPYGLENITHPLVVAESKVFRTVGEWIPPFQYATYPPVRRFWAALGVAGAGLLGVLVLRLRASATAAATLTPAHRLPPTALGVLLFDIASVGVGLTMALFARRFAPLLYILATPALVAAILRWAAPLPQRTRNRARRILTLATWPAAILAGYFATYWAYDDLVVGPPRDRPYGLLERVTKLPYSPLDEIDFLARNNLAPRVFADWVLGGPLVFFAPETRVFIDGRSQQVFNEKLYLNYYNVTTAPEGTEPRILALLEASGTEAVLLSHGSRSTTLLNAVAASPDWYPVMASVRGQLFGQRDSAFVAELVRRDRAGDLWWPDTPEAEWAHGLLAVMPPPEIARALRLWQSAVDRKVTLGMLCYFQIAKAYANLGQREAAQAYFAAQHQRVGAAENELAPDIRAKLLAEIESCQERLRPPPRGTPP